MQVQGWECCVCVCVFSRTKGRPMYCCPISQWPNSLWLVSESFCTFNGFPLSSYPISLSASHWNTAQFNSHTTALSPRTVQSISVNATPSSSNTRLCLIKQRPSMEIQDFLSRSALPDMFLCSGFKGAALSRGGTLSPSSASSQPSI